MNLRVGVIIDVVTKWLDRDGNPHWLVVRFESIFYRFDDFVGTIYICSCHHQSHLDKSLPSQ